MEASLIDQIGNSLVINAKNVIKENDDLKLDKISVNKNELKIDLYPNNKSSLDLERENIKDIISSEILHHSLDINKKISYFNSNSPILKGFYTAHTNHYPIRIKPDDIWLLIIQAFTNHNNTNFDKLRKLFVNFEGKQTLIVKYDGIVYIENLKKQNFENFVEQINEQIKGYLGKELIDNLTPNFTTTTYDSSIICKMTIMGAFSKYFDYMLFLDECGIPYIILEGTSEDYTKIIETANSLKIYEFEWYINRIIPHIEKMVEAKEGNIDEEFFKNFLQKKEIIEMANPPCGEALGPSKVDYITGWVLAFFAYIKDISDREEENKNEDKLKIFDGDILKVEDFGNLTNQMLNVPFKIIEKKTGKEYFMQFNVGFIGCDQNEKNEIFPVQGWLVSKDDRESIKEDKKSQSDYSDSDF